MAPAYVSMCILMAISPFIEYKLTGKISPAAGVYFPGVTDYNMRMNLIVWVYNVIMLVGAVSSEVPIIVLIYITFANVHMMSCILVLEIDELQEIIKIKRSHRLVREHLIFIVHMEKKFNE